MELSLVFFCYVGAMYRSKERLIEINIHQNNKPSASNPPCCMAGSTWTAQHRESGPGGIVGNPVCAG